mgnify:CR=1 FL=1
MRTTFQIFFPSLRVHMPLLVTAVQEQPSTGLRWLGALQEEQRTGHILGGLAWHLCSRERGCMTTKTVPRCLMLTAKDRMKDGLGGLGSQAAPRKQQVGCSMTGGLVGRLTTAVYTTVRAVSTNAKIATRALRITASPSATPNTPLHTRHHGRDALLHWRLTF